MVRQPSPFLIERLKLELDRVDLGIWGRLGVNPSDLVFDWPPARIPVGKKKTCGANRVLAIIFNYLITLCTKH